MIVAARYSCFSVSILDNGYSVLITINRQVKENQNVTTIKRSKENYFVFQ